jgi:hypothetical protein
MSFLQRKSSKKYGSISNGNGNDGGKYINVSDSKKSSSTANSNRKRFHRLKVMILKTTCGNDGYDGSESCISNIVIGDTYSMPTEAFCSIDTSANSFFLNNSDDDGNDGNDGNDNDDEHCYSNSITGGNNKDGSLLSALSPSVKDGKEEGYDDEDEEYYLYTAVDEQQQHHHQDEEEESIETIIATKTKNNSNDQLLLSSQQQVTIVSFGGTSTSNSSQQHEQKKLTTSSSSNEDDYGLIIELDRIWTMNDDVISCVDDCDDDDDRWSI